MNLHVTNDTYGLYPLEIAKRIKESGLEDNNLMVNLSLESTFKDDIITYISISNSSFENYVEKIDDLNKIIFHPYRYDGCRFLKIVKKRFPQVKVYWAIWSFELYNLPPLPPEYYGPFSKRYVKRSMLFPERIKELKIIGNLILQFCYLTGIKRNYIKELKQSYSQINFFCSLLPSDFSYFQKVSSNQKTKYLPFAYLSLEEIMPGLDNFNSMGNKIMVGHSSSPAGNHFEILERLYQINPIFSIFLPMAYGKEDYGDLIEAEARKMFPNADIQRKKLDKTLYYKKLTEVGWSIINVRVQQGLGNIIALIWMGVKVFLDEDSSTFKDFTEWGIVVFSVQHNLNINELSNRLTDSQIKNNKKIIQEKCNEETVKKYWSNILT
ncbi:MAG: TDP-N-acetylfucosamine:lipid II N-acetylfucosaminyltransferase [Bacteroidota bacterium]|nr:TDP-N-acetylfucosamine:lipid II N-acetylfucosaminyltransferase [Bacteroidota bacterium]